MPATPATPGRLFAAAPTPVEAELEEAQLVEFDMSEFYHGTMSQVEAEKAIKAAGQMEGTFLFRDSTKIQNDYVLSVFKDGRVVHHGIVKDGTYKIDGIPCGPATTLLEVVEWASSTHPGWNIALRDGVPGLTCASDEEILEQKLRIDMKKAQAKKAVGTVRAAVIEPSDMLAKMQERRRKQEEEMAAQEERDRLHREERARALAEAKAAAAVPKKVRSPEEIEAARQKRLQELASLPDIASFSLSRAAKVELSDDSSDDEAGPLRSLPDAARINSTVNTGVKPSDVGYLEVMSTDYNNAMSAFDPAEYMHGDISKADADALMIEAVENDPLANGKFLVRNQGRNNFILSLVHEGAPMHHLITKDETETLAVSGHSTGQTTLASLLILLSQNDVKWWPSPLTGVIKPEEKVQRRNLTKRHSARIKSFRQSLASLDGSEDLDVAAAAAAPTPRGSTRPTKASKRKSVKKAKKSKQYSKTKTNQLEQAALAICAKWEDEAVDVDDDNDGTDSQRDSGVADVDPELGPFFHRGIDKDEAAKRLGTAKGNYLLRFLKDDDLSTVIVTAVFKGQATHHLLKREDPNGTYKMNDVDLGVNSVEGIITHLSERRPYWPLKLLHGIPAPEAKGAITEEQKAEMAERKVVQKEHAKRVYRRTIIRDIKTNIFVLMGETSTDVEPAGIVTDLRAAVAALQTAESRYDSTLLRQQALQQKLAAAGATPAVHAVGTFQLTKAKRSSLDASKSSEGAANASDPVPSLKVNLGGWKKPQSSAAAHSDPLRADPPQNGAAMASPASQSSAKDDFVHASLSKDAANKLLIANGGASVSGKFLIRQKGNSEDYVLSVIYKGTPTHHSIQKSEGEFLVNKQPTGASTIADVVEHLRQKRPKWPVALTEAVLSNGASLPTATGGAVANAAAVAAPEPPAAANVTDVVHKSLSKADAEALLLQNGGADVSGKHLVRAKGASSDAFLLSVVYKGAATHHALARESNGAEFTLNKQPTGETSIAGVLKAYSQKRPKWPVALTDIVLPDGANGGAPEKSAAAKPKPKAGGLKFLHKGVKKPEADALLLADDGASMSGKFLVRTKGGSSDEFILSVIYKGNPTHHALVREGEGSEFTLNKQPTGQTTLEGVCEHYREKRPKWPVPLTQGVPA